MYCLILDDKVVTRANGLRYRTRIAAARPDIDEKTTQLVSKGRWSVPGYKVRYYLKPLPWNVD